MNVPVIIVSGLPRSGTSLTMQMLEAGGLELVTDGIRTADDDNRRGYYEYEPVKRLAEDGTWVADARGKGVKVISFLLKQLPEDADYRVIFVDRDLAEVLASQKKMLDRRGEANTTDDDTMTEVYERHLEETRDWLAGRPNFETLYVKHADLLAASEREAERIAAFVGGDLEISAMTACVDPSLHRQRSANREQAGVA